MSLFIVAGFLLFLIQCLRLFDLVADRGQSIFTLIGQAALGMPSLGIVVLYVCLGIGLGRALRNLQDRSELQVIHASALVAPLFRSVIAYAVAGAAVLLFLSHIVDPLSVRTTRSWSESIAADLVSRSMIPHRFTEVVDGVTMIIGSRNAAGEITDFFADDTRDPDLRRTYFAKNAVITRDEQGFILRMRDGATQQLTPEQRMSQISFARYDLALDQLTGQMEEGDSIARLSSIDIVGAALSSGELGPAERQALVKRSTDSLRVLAMCLFVAALALFPRGNRTGGRVPIEIVVLGAAFLERGVGTVLPAPEPIGQLSGPLLLLAVALIVLAVRFRLGVPVPLRRQTA
jgi:lipopolysaccharide export system permease protein